LRTSLCAGAAFFAVLVASCAIKPDRFYALSALPDAARGTAGTLSTHVILNVTIPPLVDRRELALDDSNGRVLILEHERWAAPFAEQVSDALARDIEQRRSDVVVGDRGFDRADAPAVRIRVDVVRMSAQRSGHATLEAHWRIVDPAAKIDAIGGAAFSAPLEAGEYSAVAQAYSVLLASLADRLVAQLPAAPAR
jgi:uncharacterized lipoprotein YmbA